MADARGIRLLLADVDGTLVTHDKLLTERARAAVKSAKAAGIAFAITSGRPPRGMSMLIKPLEITTPIAGFNGGMLVNPDLSLIEAHTLPQDVAGNVFALLCDMKLDVWIYAGQDWFIRDAKAPHVDREAWTVKFDPTVADDMQAHLQTAVKIVGVSDDLELVKRAEAEAQKRFGGSATVARSQPYYLDVTNTAANKGDVVAFLARHLALEANQIATIGDQPNDVRMFKPSGYSIAMGNAADEVKDQADTATADSEHEGFALAVEKLVAEHGTHT